MLIWSQLKLRGDARTANRLGRVIGEFKTLYGSHFYMMGRNTPQTIGAKKDPLEDGRLAVIEGLFVVSPFAAIGSNFLPKSIHIKKETKLPDAIVVSKALTPPEAAALLQISQKTLIKMAAAGELPAFRAGRLWRFPAVALEKWLASFEQSYQPAS